MKIVVFGPERRVGVLVGTRVIDINRANGEIPPQLENFIAAGKSALFKAKEAVAKASIEVSSDVNSVTLHAPWCGKRIAMVGGNYADHLAGMVANQHGEPLTGDSIRQAYDMARKKGHWGFWKVLTEVAGNGDEILFPKKTKYLDYEGEVAIVIGKQGKDISVSEISDYVWGVTLVNDWSCRDNRGEPRSQSYNYSKNFDRSCTVGPCIVVDEVDCQNVDVETRVNGEVRQRFNSKDMIFNFGEVLEYLSCDFTFVPGDMIGGGTAAGTAADKTKRLGDGSRPTELFLKPGDFVEVSSPQVGSIRNEIV